ncbi:hypothetical protein FCM35_KLT09787 [Carex littledalei]|uniref:Uncharacterized protein n=1 Tax=Carex littledalei TaxID=544730 RepID=A0A833RUG3_9POAL|nr:hypothetical protein FCM35_KLT09787 [Carex littledalei]
MEQEASKKAKREEEAGSVDEIMSDSFAEEEEEKEAKREEVSKKARREEEEELRSIFRALEYKLFSRAYVDSDRADKISSEEDARRLFTDEEWKMFSTKQWHMQPTPGKFDDYQRLAIYRDVDHQFYRLYADLHYPYAFDRKYLEFTQELNETIKWGTTLSGVRATAEQIWRKHILVPSLNGLGPFDTDMMLRDESNREEFVPALRAIITANGLESYPFNKGYVEDFLGDEEGYFNSLTTMNRCFKRRMEVSCCCTTAIVVLFNSNPIQFGAGEVST